MSAKEKFDWAKSMERIEEIVKKLEEGSGGLDESISLFEEGTKLVRSCQEELARAEVRVKKLIDGGDHVEEDLFGVPAEGEEG